jgi:hypothetical protein
LGIVRRAGGNDLSSIRQALAEQASCSEDSNDDEIPKIRNDEIRDETLDIRGSGGPSGEQICCHQNDIKGEEKQPCSIFKDRDYRYKQSF